MGRCPWHGEVCNCGQGWPFPENGLMPARCEARLPLEYVAMYPKQVSPEKAKAYADVLAARMGEPKAPAPAKPVTVRKELRGMTQLKLAKQAAKIRNAAQ
jgi:hypothetical protein